MKNRTIDQLIDAINKGDGRDRIFARPLMANVKLARAWPEYPQGDVDDESGYLFYFIYSEEGSCIAAILDMGPGDLHVYVKNEHRRRGVMTCALRDIVLPHLLRNEREEQKVTFTEEAARGLLEKIGFTILGENSAVIRKEEIQSVDFPGMESVPFPEDRKEALKKRIRLAAGLLQMASDELRMYQCGTLPDETEESAYFTKELAYHVEDAWYNARG